jgi:hypothetical protein
MRLRRDPAPRGWHPSVTRQEMQEGHQATLRGHLETIDLALEMRQWGLVQMARDSIAEDLGIGNKTYAQALAEIRSA